MTRRAYTPPASRDLTFQALLVEMADKLYFLIEERAGYCAQLDVELRDVEQFNGTTSAPLIAQRTAAIVEMATAIAGVARAANTRT